MLRLILILAPIALIDSISPVRMGAMVTILCGRRAVRRGAAFMLGVAVGYFFLGAAFALAGRRLLEIDLILDPTHMSFFIGLMVGIALVVVGVRFLLARPVEKDVAVDETAGMLKTVLLGLAITVITMPTAIPLFAAVNQILRSDATPVEAWIALAIYCAIYLTPLAALMTARVVLGDRAETVMKRTSTALASWMGRLMALLLILLGAANIVDALGWFLFNHPLF